MKKQLLATTALVGASLLVTGDALAQASPIQMGVHGYFRTFFEVYSVPSNSDMVDAPLTGFGIPTYGTTQTMGKVKNNQVTIESRTYFQGEGKLDNGITPGVQVNFESLQRQYNAGGGGSPISGVTIGNQVRRVQGYFKGAFGEFRGGNMDHAGRPRQTYGALNNGILGADSPSGAYPLGTNNTTPDLVGRAAKIQYTTPTFAGFDFAISYAPSQSAGGANADVTQFEKQGVTNNAYGGKLDNSFDPALRYMGTFGGFKVQGDAAYVFTDNQCKGRTTAASPNFNAACNPSFFNGNSASITSTTGGTTGDNDITNPWVHGSVQYMGFELGMGWSKLNNIRGNGLNTEVIAPGLSYTTGPWTFGVQYSHGEYDTIRAPLVTGAAGTPLVGTQVAGSTPSKSTDKLDMVTANVSYLLGPGVNLHAGYAYQKYTYGANAAYRNANDTGFSSIGNQTAHTVIGGFTFSY